MCICPGLEGEVMLTAWVSSWLNGAPLKTTPVWRCGEANEISLKQEIVSFSFTLKTKNVSKLFRRDLAGLFVELSQKDKAGLVRKG